MNRPGFGGGSLVYPRFGGVGFLESSLRLYGITEADIEAVIASPEERDTDTKGNPRYTGKRSRRRARVVVSKEDRNVVKTVYPRRR